VRGGVLGFDYLLGPHRAIVVVVVAFGLSYTPLLEKMYFEIFNFASFKFVGCNGISNIVLVGYVIMVSKINYTGSVNRIRKCILVINKNGATCVPSFFFCVLCYGGVFVPATVLLQLRCVGFVRAECFRKMHLSS
jgi:hypothetical protein